MTRRKTSIPKVKLALLMNFYLLMSYGQVGITISGTIKDSTDGSKISYATVSISGTTIGTTSDQSGQFTLSIPADQTSGSLTVSSLGYSSIHLPITAVKISGNVITLQRKSFSLNEINVTPAQKHYITAKMIEKMMAKISDTLYMSKYETSVYLYKAFLEDICRRNDAVCDSAGFHYNDAYTKRNFGYNSQVYWLNTPGGAEGLPVSDITHGGAEQFCKWLTEKYSEFKKRKYKKAMFRLPSSDEWTYAAQGGGKEQTRFPWPGNEPYHIQPNDTMRHYYIWFIGSYDTIIKHNGFIGFTFVTNGYTNKFGLRHVCGNAAEMVQEKGVYRGGCSMDKIENIGIYTPQEPNRKDPDYFIGFRFAMVKE